MPTMAVNTISGLTLGLVSSRKSRQRLAPTTAIGGLSGRVDIAARVPCRSRGLGRPVAGDQRRLRPERAQQRHHADDQKCGAGIVQRGQGQGHARSARSPMPMRNLQQHGDDQQAPGHAAGAGWPARGSPRYPSMIKIEPATSGAQAMREVNGDARGIRQHAARRNRCRARATARRRRESPSAATRSAGRWENPGRPPRRSCCWSSRRAQFAAPARQDRSSANCRKPSLASVSCRAVRRHGQPP